MLQRLAEAIGHRYRLVRELGAGGMGSVYLAEDQKLGRQVAIKVLHPELAATVTAARFLQEIRIAAGLAHPHIVPVHDSGDAEGLLYFMMAFQEGESLRDLLEREGPLPVPKAIAIARDVAAGLAYAHHQGVVHRDIKPANILLAGDQALIADFGVARAVEEAARRGLTSTAASVGTPMYMSPEQASGDNGVDGRADLYSLGCVLYEMLTGEPPVRGKSIPAVMAGHLHGRITPVRSARAEISGLLSTIVHRALAKSPDDRFQTGSELRQALDSAQAQVEGSSHGVLSRWRWYAGRSRRRVALVGGLALAGLVGLAVGVARLTGFPGVATPDASTMVVLPFSDAITTPDEGTLSVALADELTRQLNGWESVTAVSPIALTGARFDLGIDEPALHRIDDGLAVAREVSAGTMVTLATRIRGDSAIVTASLFDTRTGRARGRLLEVGGGADDPFPLAAEVAHDILGLDGPVEEIAGLQRQSNIPAAVIEYESGRRALERWSLLEAEECFRTAADMDSTFAMAQHKLALTLYLQGADGLESLAEVGPDIALASARALRRSGDLPLRDSLHILAFNRFQAGDFQEARAWSRTLLSRDSTDVYAWLLQGSIEYKDPWLEKGVGGKLRPRANFNLARRSFSETARLAPGFHLAYGRLFDIATQVARSREHPSAPAFEVPREELIAPWAVRDPLQVEAFVLLRMDSLIWVPKEEFDALPDLPFDGRADALLDESVGLLRRWAAYEPDNARPRRELAEWSLTVRSRLRGPQPPSLVDSLTREALEFATEAMTLTADTTRRDLFLLGNLRLAAGDVIGAKVALQAGLDWDTSGSPSSVPSLASNVLLFSGRPAQAMELLDLERPHRRYYADSVAGDLVDDGGTEPLVQRILIMGATGVSGPPLEQAFLELMDHWSRFHQNDRRKIDFLREWNARRLSVALSNVPLILESWTRDLELRDPLWAALQEGAHDRESLLRAALETREEEIDEPSRSYLMAKVASDIGDPHLALRLHNRLDSLPLGLKSRDTGWGLRGLSYLERAKLYEATGDERRAHQFHARFSEAWEDPDMMAFVTGETREWILELTGSTRPRAEASTGTAKPSSKKGEER